MKFQEFEEPRAATPDDIQRAISLAERKPLAVCLSKGQGLGHVVGIPPKLREYRDKIFDLMPGAVNVAIEIGTLQGWFAWRCMKFLPDATLFCVDSFEDSEEYGSGEYNLRCWKRNLRSQFGKRVFLKRGRSAVEAEKWGNGVKADFLFINGDHSATGCLLDLESWVPKVRPGGLVAGHGIDGPHGENVRQALEAFCTRSGIKRVSVGKVYSFTGVQVTKCWWFYVPMEARQ